MPKLDADRIATLATASIDEIIEIVQSWVDDDPNRAIEDVDLSVVCEGGWPDDDVEISIDGAQRDGNAIIGMATIHFDELQNLGGCEDHQESTPRTTAAPYRVNLDDGAFSFDVDEY